MNVSVLLLGGNTHIKGTTCFCFTNKHMQTLKLKPNRFVRSTVRHNDHDRQNAHKQQQIQTTSGHIFHKHQQIQPIFSIMMSLDRNLHVTLTAYSKNYKTQTNPNKNSLKTQIVTNFLPGFGSLKQPVARLGLFLQHNFYLRCRWGFS